MERMFSESGEAVYPGGLIEVTGDFGLSFDEIGQPDRGINLELASDSGSPYKKTKSSKNKKDRSDKNESSSKRNLFKRKRAEKSIKIYFNRFHPFKDWTRDEMIRLLINRNIELKCENSLSPDDLRELCEALYLDCPVPEKPNLPNDFDFFLQNVSAQRIQNCWINYLVEKRKKIDLEKQNNYYKRAFKFKKGGKLIPMSLDDDDDPEDRLLDRAATVCFDSFSLKQDEKSETSDELNGDREAVKGPVNVLDVPWTIPDWEKARRYADFVQPRKGGKGGSKFNFFRTTTGRHCCLGSCGEQWDLWEEGQVSEFALYGSGITNYFKFLKWCAWVFTILAIISLPSLLLNLYGPNVLNSGLNEIAQTTAGNLASQLANTTVSVYFPGCNNYEIFDIQCKLDKSALASFFSVTAIVVSLVVFIALAWLIRFEKLEEDRIDKNTLNVSTFSIVAWNVPPDTNEDEIQKHFESLCPGHKIADISFAYDNRQEIKECFRRGDLVKSKLRLVHDHRYTCTKIRSKPGLTPETAEEEILAERESFLMRMSTIDAELQNQTLKLQEIGESPSRVLCAFVTFNRVAGKEAALKLYQNIRFYNKNIKLRLRDYLLDVKPAPEPSTILWENLGFSWWYRFVFHSSITFGAVFLVLISLLIVLTAKYIQVAVIGINEVTSACPEQFYSWTKDQQISYVTEFDSELHCYCDQFSLIEQNQNSECKSYLRNQINSQLLIFFSTAVVLFVNWLIEMLLRKSSIFEWHHTEEDRSNSVLMRVFLLKYINTCVIFFINNRNILVRLLFNLSEQSSDSIFSASWFNTVGVTIILVQLGDIFTNHGDKMSKWLKFNFFYQLAVTDPRSALTQEELNKLHIGPEFEIGFKYSQLLSTIFACLTFSSGMPILYAIGAVNFALFYFIEKYLFINLYRIPPHFSNSVGKRAFSVIPLAIVLHLFSAIWLLSNQSMFDNRGENQEITGNSGNERDRDTISSDSVFPLFLFLLLIFILFGCYQILVFIDKFYQFTSSKWFLWVKKKLKGANKNQHRSKSAGSVISFTHAIQRNLIKGLSTYSILQNPEYKDKFAITWRFAITHNSVRNVKNIKQKAQVKEEEVDAEQVELMQRNMNLHTMESKKKFIQEQRNLNKSFYFSVLGPATPIFDPKNPEKESHADRVKRLLSESVDDSNHSGFEINPRSQKNLSISESAHSETSIKNNSEHSDIGKKVSLPFLNVAEKFGIGTNKSPRNLQSPRYNIQNSFLMVDSNYHTRHKTEKNIFTEPKPDNPPEISKTHEKKFKTKLSYATILGVGKKSEMDFDQNGNISENIKQEKVQQEKGEENDDETSRSGSFRSSVHELHTSEFEDTPDYKSEAIDMLQRSSDSRSAELLEDDNQDLK